MPRHPLYAKMPKVPGGQVRCLNLLHPSDNEGMGEKSSTAAGLTNDCRQHQMGALILSAARQLSEPHCMDERTPHLRTRCRLDSATAERKKQSEGGDRKKLLLHLQSRQLRPALCADDIMERKDEPLSGHSMPRLWREHGPERGIRGSEARHIGQHEYYANRMAVEERS